MKDVPNVLSDVVELPKLKRENIKELTEEAPNTNQSGL